MVREQHICQNNDRAFQNKTSLTAVASGVAEEGNVIMLRTGGHFDEAKVQNILCNTRVKGKQKLLVNVKVDF